MREVSAQGRSGLQAEVLTSLAVVLAMAIAVLGAVLGRIQTAQLDQLRPLAARTLVQEANSPLVAHRVVLPGAQWWSVSADGGATRLSSGDAAIDEQALDLAREARKEDKALLRAGALWAPMRFAAPIGGAVLVARLPAAASPGLVATLGISAVAVVVAFSLYLLRRRVVRPLERLADGVRAIRDGRLDAHVPEEGSRETAELAHAFNEMREALEARTVELEKAVVELRGSNRSLREARAGLDRAERLAAVGRLAAGVAHEVGNPMGAMLAFMDLARRASEGSEEGCAHIDRAMREGGRVRAILRQLLDFSRPPRGSRGPVDLAAVCEEMAELVRAQRRYAAIDIAIEREGDPPAALADRDAVTQIVLNLLLNAADALRGGTEGPSIRATVRPGPLQRRDGETPEAARGRKRFDAVELWIEDNGPGIPADDRERIFDPFFTTKDPGEGTGLGLANALRFAEQYDGNLDLDAESALGGAAFVLRLPVAGDGENEGRVRGQRASDGAKDTA